MANVLRTDYDRDEPILNNPVLLPDWITTDRLLLEQAGFKFSTSVDSEKTTHRHCELPKGWYLKASEVANWSHIYDTEDVRRVAIFESVDPEDKRSSIVSLM